MPVSQQLPYYIRPLPCIDCLTLPACIGRLTKTRYIITKSTPVCIGKLTKTRYIITKSTLYSEIVNILCPICCYIESYLQPYDYYDYILARRQRAVQFYLEKVNK
jgi:hypothetical protein